MYNFSYSDLCKMVKKGLPLYVWAGGQKFTLFIGEGEMLYYKHKYDIIVYKLKMNDVYSIGLD